MKNKFITFEGGEGAGKTTQIKLLAEFLRGQGCEVLVTREPGGTANGEIIREWLLSKAEWEVLSEVLLNFTARLEHVEKLIKPALAAGKWVLCDRFFDSTVVYQGYGQGVSLEKISEIKKLVLGEFAPDKTVLLDIDPKIALARAHARGEINRFEKMGIEFHQKIRDGFLRVASENKQRFVVVNAALAYAEVAAEIQSIIN